MPSPNPSNPSPDRNGFTQNGNHADARVHYPNSDAPTIVSVSDSVSAPLDNWAIFTQMIEVAERAGRTDLVYEFRQRLTQSVRGAPGQGTFDCWNRAVGAQKTLENLARPGVAKMPHPVGRAFVFLQLTASISKQHNHLFVAWIALYCRR
jgi:hypothetical protein